ncbi:MAG: hypothetical protein V1793_15325 [Pseudomonadota bacterium]
MIKRILIITVICLGFAGYAAAAEVAQGKCVKFDEQAMTMVVEEYDINFSKANPYGISTGIVSEFNCNTAMIGITPKPGDILRIAYDVQGEKKIALKVMNVSKQDLRKK